MSRRRYVSTSISTDTRVKKLVEENGAMAALLYTWMIPHAEDDGTLSGDPEEILLTVIPGMQRDLEPSDVATMIAAMNALGLVEWEGQRLKFPASFYKYQRYISETRRERKTAQPSSIKEVPAQNSAEPRESAQNSASFKSSFSSPVSSPVSVNEKDAAVATAEPVSQGPSAEIKQVFEHYKLRIQPRAEVCPDAKLKTRLKRWGLPRLLTAIDRFAENEWWMERNAQQGAAWFFETDARIEKFLNLEPRREERTHGTNQNNGTHGRDGAKASGPARHEPDGRPKRDYYGESLEEFQERERVHAARVASPPGATREPATACGT